MNVKVRDWLTGAAIGAVGGPMFFFAIFFLAIILKEPYGLLAYYALLAVPLTHYPLRYTEKCSTILNIANRKMLVRGIRVFIWILASGILWKSLPSGWFIIAIILQLAICFWMDVFMWGQRFALPQEISNKLIPEEKRQSVKRHMIHPTAGLIFVVAYALIHLMSSDPRIMAKRPLLINLVLMVTAFWGLLFIQARREAMGISRWRSVLMFTGFAIGLIALPFLEGPYAR